MKIGVIGLGKLGCSMFAAFAASGNEVVGYDVNVNSRNKLKINIKPVFETKFAEHAKTSGLATVDAVEVKQVSAEPEKSFMPEHPQADSDGYVYKAAVNVDQEMVEMMEAGRQYQNNIEVISTIRALMMRTLSLGK